MPFQIDRLLDSLGWHILRLLQENARLSFRQIGEHVGLTAPAVTERVHRLEEAGILTGYHAHLSMEKAGLPIMAFVHLTTTNASSMRFRTAITHMAEVIECHCVTGNESYILKVAVTSVAHLEHFLMDLKNYGEMRTSLILSTQVARRVINGPFVQTESD